jgi:hypothetical protein
MFTVIEENSYNNNIYIPERHYIAHKYLFSDTCRLPVNEARPYFCKIPQLTKFKRNFRANHTIQVSVPLHRDNDLQTNYKFVMIVIIKSSHHINALDSSLTCAFSATANLLC